MGSQLSCSAKPPLYQLVGWSMMAGVGVMLAMVPLNGFVARYMKTLQKEQMKNKDTRSRLIAPDTMASVPATTFPRFLDLPFEIRWAIYKLCLPTRVVDSGIVTSCVSNPYTSPRRTIPSHSGIVTELIELILSDLPWLLGSPELDSAFWYIVGKYCRMPVISRAIPEVYRKIRQHVVPPPADKRAWNWVDASGYPKNFYMDPRPILFDPKSDILYLSPRFYDNDPKILGRSPCWLARSPDAIVALEAWAMEARFYPDTMTRYSASLMNYCLVGRKHCIIVLSETRLIKPMEWIISCGLFGLFGEERTILVDVDDFELIDYYDKKLNGQVISPRKWSKKNDDPLRLGGIRRYSSHGTVDPRLAWTENSPVVSTEDRALLIAEDKKEVLRRLKLAWLDDNGCWDRKSPNFLPHERFPDLPKDWDQVFDEEHPTAKRLLDKLPAFSFAVRLHAQDLEECRRLREAATACKCDWDAILWARMTNNVEIDG